MRGLLFVTTLLLLLSTVDAGEMSIEEAIEQRQAAFKAMKGEVKKLKEAMSAKEPANRAAIGEPAEQIVINSKSLIGTFVTGSYKGKTRAKKKIWKNWADFEQRQNKLIADAENLSEASKAGDQAGVKAAFKKLAGNCKGCHRRYRQIM